MHSLSVNYKEQPSVNKNPTENTNTTNAVLSPSDNPDHIETVSIEIVETGNNDDSVASADYFVPEPNLNYRVPTSQQQLMQ